MARIAGVDLPREKRIEIGLTYIYGIGRTLSNEILAETKINPDTRVKDLTDDQISKLRESIEKKINDYEKLKAIANVCAFYCICYYYTYKTEFPSVDLKKSFNYEKFYSEKSAKEKIVQAFSSLFLSETIRIIKDLTINSPNLNTWIRDKKSTQLFNDKINNELQINLSLEDRYCEFVEKAKE
jgi:ribosomal protein S13